MALEFEGDATGTTEEEVKAESPAQQGKSDFRVASGKGRQTHVHSLPESCTT